MITLAITMTSVAAAMAAYNLPGLDKHPSYVQCRCHKSEKNQGCKASHSGNACAGGKNIQCTYYDSNCA